MEIGETITVLDPEINDLWNHSFVGTVVALKENGIISVSDQDGEVFDIEEYQYEKTIPVEK